MNSPAETPSGGAAADQGFLSDLKDDLPASLVVFFVAVPLCLGIALASGAPLISGLIAGIVGGIIVGIISGSPLGVSGPAAGLAVIVLGAIEDLGGFEVFLVAVVIGGAIQILLGLLRAGVLAYFFPSSVIKGMLAGIGILIVMKQIPHALGHDSDPEGDLTFQQPDGENTLSAFGAMLEDYSMTAIAISAVCLAILIFWEAVLVRRSRIFKLIQGPLVAVVVAVLMQMAAVAFFPEWALASTHLVSVPVSASLGEVTSMLTHPDWSQIGNQSVWIVGITLAVVASLETLLCVDATDKLDEQKRITPTNRELVAQGVGNITSGLIGGLPVTQVIVRSSANIQSGGRSKTSAILHGCFLLLFVTLLPHLLNKIPLAALASILFVVGYKLASPALFKRMFALGMSQFLPFIITIAGIVFTDLLTGIGYGMVAALFAILRSHYMNSHFLHIRESTDARGHHVTVELAEQVTFLNKGAILRELKSIGHGSHVVLDASNCTFIDQDVLEVIEDFEVSAHSRAITVERIGNFTPNVRSPKTRPRPAAEATAS